MSVDINLLGWREARRETRTRHFHLLVGLMVMLGTVIGFGVAQGYQMALDTQQERNSHISRQVSQLEADIRAIQDYESDLNRLGEQITVFQELQSGRTQVVQVFNSLAESLVDGVYYTRQERVGQTLNVTGLSTSNRQVSDQLRSLADAPAFDVPRLSEVESESGGAGRRFRLSVILKAPASLVETEDGNAENDA
ncbi:PilN domain-containing protein [Vreelandella rituensis]|uniref:Fimbrial assembly protein n=1 Tax=Vreelandella rituensis TaxID=2282306 RepID=A0A368U2S5_9GAMM|nr:PilN domain-containing protein [Halomonas rituensis]RCV91348.1 fimbrial assembly protein [Halomonas rituensis]